MNPLRSGFQIGDWRVSPLDGTLTGPAGTVHVEPKVMDVLLCLASHAGELVERDRLLAEVWGTRVVSDEPLTRCVAQLRSALGDDRRRPKYIQTVPKRGYRLICTVVPDPEENELTSPSSVATRPVHPRAARLLWVVASLALVALSALAVRGLIDAPDRVAQDQQQAPALSTGQPLARDRPVVEALAASEASTVLRSIAVLPFRTPDDGSGHDLFAESMREDILVRLTKISDIDRVIPGTSTERYRGTDLSVQDIGRELGVTAVLEGGVQREGDRVKVNVHLVDTRRGESIWAESFERDIALDQLFDVQSEITRRIAAELRARLGAEERLRLDRQPTNSLGAYLEYGEGLVALRHNRLESYARAAAHFERAIELDPDYARAYSGLALSLVMPRLSKFREADDQPERIEWALQRALELDPELSEAHAALGFIRMARDHNDAAESALRRAIELNPSNAHAHNWLAHLMRVSGRPEEAMHHMREAMALHHGTASLLVNYAAIQFQLGRTEDALALLRDLRERQPDYADAYGLHALILWEEGRVAEALRWAERAAELDPDHALYVFRVCHIRLDLGDHEGAEACIDAAEARLPDGLVPTRAFLEMSRRNPERALEVLREFVTRRQEPVAFMLIATLQAQLGEHQAAFATLSEWYPELAAGRSNFDRYDVLETTAAALVLHDGGLTERADRLFDEALETMDDMQRFGRLGTGYGPLDAFIHAARGERQRAARALEAAVDGGWRMNWAGVYDFEDMVGYAPWDAQVARLEDDIRAQRAWYEAHKDKPLEP